MKHLALSLLALAPTVLSQTQIPLPVFSSTFNGSSRGFYFQTPVPITIVGLRVPDEAAAGVQNVEVSLLTAAPPLYPATASGGQVFYATNVPSSYIIPCKLDFAANDWVGVMGSCGTTTQSNSYGAGNFASSIGGNPVTLSRLLTQTNLNTVGGQPYSTEASGSIARVEVYYTTPQVPGVVALPGFGSTFSSTMTRGFYFQTPVPIIIRGLRVPDEFRDGIQNVEVKRMGAAPPAYPTLASGGEVFLARNVPSWRIIPCFLPFSANDWIGVIGACGTATQRNSYATPAGVFASSIGGNPVNLTRMGTQTNLNAVGAQPYWSEAAGAIARVEVYYELATGVADSSPYGLGCNRASRAFYELSSAAAFDLGGSAMTLSLNAGRYSAIPVGAYVVPPGGATNLALGDDTDATVTLASSFPHPGGSTTSLRVCSNGFVSVATGNGTSFTPSAAVWCNSLHARWGDWHDFNPGVGGAVKFHETGTISYVTWDGVFDFGVAASPNTWQLQFNRSNGNVTYVWQTMTGLGGNHLVGYAPSGLAANLGSMDISAALVAGFSTQNFDLNPLTLSSGRPVIGTTINLVTDFIPAGTLFGASLLGLVPTSTPLAPIGAPTCTQYVNGIVTNLWIGGGPTVTQPFNVPGNPIYLGAHIYGQSVAYRPGINALNAITSNGLDLLLDLN